MRTLIAIPCMDMMHTEFVQSLVGMRKVGEIQFGFVSASLIYDARDELAQKAIEMEFDRVLWLDSDVTFESDLMERLSEDLDSGLKMVSGLYFSRKGPVRPTIFKDCMIERLPEGKLCPTANYYMDYPRDQIFQIAACGFGAVMMETSLLKQIKDKLGMPFSPAAGFGEDLSFCLRADNVGEKIWCDSRVKLGHVGYRTITEEIYTALRDEQAAAKKENETCANR